MSKKLLLTIILSALTFFSFSQVKIGSNIEEIHNSSILELDSKTLALVITRVNNQEMVAINPLQGAMVYNTDTQCIHFFEGNNWQNLCENTSSGTFTFFDNQNGTFTINYSDGTSFTSMDLTGPQGPSGVDGESAYQIWLNEGNSGTEADFLASLIGETGPEGPPGNSSTTQQQVVIIASEGQTQFNTPSPIDDDQKIEVYRNGIRVDFTTLNTSTIRLENDITCYQNDSIRIVQIL